MKRIPLYLTACYTAGIIIGIYTGYQKYISFILILLFLLTMLLYFKGRKVFCLIYLLVFTFGVSSSSYEYYRIQNFAEEFREKKITVKGQISSDIEFENNTASYIMFVDNIICDGTEIQSMYKMKVVDYRNKKGYIVPYNSVALSGNFSGSYGSKNTGMRDNQLYLFEKNICGTLTVDYNSNISSVKYSKRLFSRIIHNTRLEIESILDYYLKKDVSQMLKGVLLGDTSNIQNEDYDNYKKCGILHIFAVSGFNIYLLYSILNVVLSMLNKRRRTAVILILLFVYTVITGGTPSIMRAFIMAAILMTGKVLKREADPLNSMSIAALAIQIINPLSITNIGFQLSFAAVLSIILIYPKIKRVKLPVYGGVRGIIDTTASVQIGILPLSLYQFNSFTVFSLVSNMLIIPLVSALTVLGVILIMVHYCLYFSAPIISFVINAIGYMLLRITAIISSIPYASIDAISPTIIEILLYYTVLVYLFNIANIRNKYSMQVLMIIVVIGLCIFTANLLPGELVISFVDVGQGDCIFIRTPDKKTILIDGGGKPNINGDSYDIGENVVKPYLLKHNVNKIDMIISTHSHDDHLKGLITVMEVFYVDNFIKSSICEQEKYEELIRSGIIMEDKITNVSDGDVIDTGKIKFYIMNPEFSSTDENDSSIVTLLKYDDFDLLLTGDISSRVEERLMEQNIEADILKLPHHGSSTSLDSSFLSKINPKFAIISVGINSYGHPSEEVIKKLQEKKVKIYRTDKNGEIIIKTNGRRYSIKTVA